MRNLIVFLLSASTAVAASIAPSEYAARRAKLASQVGPNAVVFVFSAPAAHRNGDVDWPYRQSDNMLYLTGIDAPDTTLVLMPDEPKEILFVRDRNPRQELWTGKILTHDEVSAISGIKEIESSSRASRFLNTLIEGTPYALGNAQMQYYSPAAFPQILRAVREGRAEVWVALPSRFRDESSSPEMRFASEVSKQFPDVKVRDATPLLRAMRVIKTPAEIAVLQRAIEISDAGQKAGMKRALTATNEREVQATIEYTFRVMGACCWGYESIVASGKNATTLHYESDDAPIDRKGLMLTDVGAEVDGYTADVTRTYPVSGKFTDAQRAIYEAVFKAQNAGLELMRPGHTFREANDKVADTLGAELLKLGLITKNEPAQVRWYLPYAFSHQIGLDVHDVVETGTPFLTNMVVTNEPGVYVRPDDVTSNEAFRALTPADQQSVRAALAKYDGIGVRIEDDILITDGAAKILSSNSPRSVADIEAFLATPGK